MPHEAIAQALKIDAKTLRKHYGTELASGANLRRMQVLETLFGQARKGSTSAARAYMQHVPEFEVLAPGPEAAKPKGKGKQEPLGKKAQANEDAKGAQAGTDWDGLLPPGVTPIRAAK